MYKISGTLDLNERLYKVSGPIVQDFRKTSVEKEVVQGFRTTRTRFQEHFSWNGSFTMFWDNLHKISGTLDLEKWLYMVSGPLVQDFRNTKLHLSGRVVLQGFGTTYTRFQEHFSWNGSCTMFQDLLYKISGTPDLNE